MKIRIAASVLSADFSCLGKEIKKVRSAGADMLHIDVMDGCFVPNISLGPVVIKDIRRATKLPLDTHLMIARPASYIDAFIRAGSDMITLHIETISRSTLRANARKLKARGIKFGVSLKPATPLARIEGVLDAVDFVLVMSVNPGFGGQEFMPRVLPKIRQLRSVFNKDIAVDGGINHDNAARLKDAGANVLVAGSYIFQAKDYSEAIRRLRNA